MRRIVPLAVVLASTAAPAGAASLEEKYESRYDRVKVKEALPHPGRDIAEDGLSPGDDRRLRPTMRKSAQRMLRWLRELRAPEPVVIPIPSTVTVPPAGPVAAAGGTYCGLFQFDQSTWESVGGSGSPCAASPSEQYSRAERLQSERGNQPWPSCGQGGASLEAIAECESGGDPNAVGG